VKKKNAFYLLGGFLLLGFAGFSVTAFKSSMTPYVTFEQARDGHRMVQVAGALEKGSSSYADEQDSLFFTLKDPKTRATLRVRYKGIKPGNFEDAVSIVAIGHFDPEAKQFEAAKLLVKCPSKYQGAEVKEYS
jgi:cytochrome c-type biogenesis protein CcmE